MGGSWRMNAKLKVKKSLFEELFVSRSDGKTGWRKTKYKIINKHGSVTAATGYGYA